MSIAPQKFATSITDCKGSDTTWELRMGYLVHRPKVWLILVRCICAHLPGEKEEFALQEYLYHGLYTPLPWSTLSHANLLGLRGIKLTRSNLEQ